MEANSKEGRYRLVKLDPDQAHEVEVFAAQDGRPDLTNTARYLINRGLETVRRERALLESQQGAA